MHPHVFIPTEKATNPTTPPNPFLELVEMNGLTPHSVFCEHKVEAAMNQHSPCPEEEEEEEGETSLMIPHSSYSHLHPSPRLVPRKKVSKAEIRLEELSNP